MDVQSIRLSLLHHIDSYWSLHEKELLPHDLGPLSAQLPQFRIARIPPNSPTEPWVHLTIGAWELTAPSHTGAEFLLLAAEANPQHLDTLARVVRHHAVPSQRLSVGAIVPLGRGVIDGSALDHALVTLPYPYNVNLEYVAADDFAIRVHWLVPITADEAAFAARSGVEALEERLQAAAIDFLDPMRHAVV